MIIIKPYRVAQINQNKDAILNEIYFDGTRKYIGQSNGTLRENETVIISVGSNSEKPIESSVKSEFKVYEYDSLGNLIYQLIYDSVEMFSLLKKKTYIYDINGNLSTISSFDYIKNETETKQFIYTDEGLKSINVI